MDYAVQLLAIICLFLFGGLWLKDHMGLPMWGVVILFFVGFGTGMTVLYLRGKEESAKFKKEDKTETHASAPSKNGPDDDSSPLVELGIWDKDDDEERK